MKNVFIPLLVLTFLLLNSCDMVPGKEAELIMLPTSMSATVVMGSNTTKIMADFHYLPDSDLLDHITWSNHQTHFFTYNDLGQLSVVRQLKVLEKVQDECWFSYEGDRVSEVLLTRKNLDYAYLEPLDSSYTGRIKYEYEGNLVICETEYEINSESKEEFPVRKACYGYDADGNIISSLITYPTGNGEEESVEMTYDSGKHPFSGLAYYFTGESFVNNQLTRTSGIMDYVYDVRLNEQKYPEAIYEKLGSSNTRIFRYTYMSR